jgi:hypothetical protein
MICVQEDVLEQAKYVQLGMKTILVVRYIVAMAQIVPMQCARSKANVLGAMVIVMQQDVLSLIQIMNATDAMNKKSN